MVIYMTKGKDRENGGQTTQHLIFKNIPPYLGSQSGLLSTFILSSSRKKESDLRVMGFSNIWSFNHLIQTITLNHNIYSDNGITPKKTASPIDVDILKLSHFTKTYSDSWATPFKPYILSTSKAPNLFAQDHKDGRQIFSKLALSFLSELFLLPPSILYKIRFT